MKIISCRKGFTGILDNHLIFWAALYMEEMSNLNVLDVVVEKTHKHMALVHSSTAVSVWQYCHH